MAPRRTGGGIEERQERSIEMGRTLSEKLKAMPAARRRKVEARAKKLRVEMVREGAPKISIKVRAKKGKGRRSRC
jgi:hypothetical protein